MITGSISEKIALFLVQQKWFGAKDRTIESVDIEQVTTLKKEWPALVQMIARIQLSDSTQSLYHLLIGLRPPGEFPPFLEGGPELVIGDVETEHGDAIAYEALRDPELGKVILSEVDPSQEVELVRPITSEQSNTSLIFDDRLILKIFRRLTAGPNPDIEVADALWRVEFGQIPEPVGRWSVDELDFAVLRKYLTGGSEGWALALTSLRDFYNQKGLPEDAGGDFSAEAARLGEMTADLHIALAKAFGQSVGDPDAWAEMMQEQLSSVPLVAAYREKLDAVFEELRDVDDPGPAIRVHGDYHLGQVMRTDEGWLVLDFEGEPARSVESRKMHLSPLKDVAGMLRSFHYAASAALNDHDEDVLKLASAWEQRNREAFLDGYIAIAHTGGLLPSDVSSLEAVLKAYEVDKAIYEVAYEAANRPDWLQIPLSAIDRIIEGTTRAW